MAFGREKLWYWHGVQVTQQIIEQPQTLTPDQVCDERTVSVRRVMLERLGARLDPDGRLHCEDGPAVEFGDGSRWWYWHGAVVTQHFIEQPEKATLAQFLNEGVAAVRLLMLERLGARLDPDGRLHCEDGPAVEFSDGPRWWYWHGVRVTQHFIEHLKTQTAGQIEAEALRRYLREGDAHLLHQDEVGRLWRLLKPLPDSEQERPRNEPLVIVEVVNSTPEPDGSFKDYFLRVPPGVGSAREAIAWTFDVSEDEYVLEAQS
jgi:hypothetical protein